MDSSNNSEYRLLLDLDALLDTRLGTLLLLDPAAPKTAVENGYYTRTIDDFEELTTGAVTNEQFNVAYAKRDLDTLKSSIITGIPHVLVSYLETIRERYLRKLEVSNVLIDINLFPYTLPGPDVQMIIQAFGVMIPEFVKINAVRVDPTTLPPDEFKKSYDGWCTYDFDAWFKVHHQTLLFKRANELTVILPRLHISKPGELDEKLNGFQGLDTHNLHAMVMEEFIRLEYLPVCDYCFFTPGMYGNESSEEG